MTYTRVPRLVRYLIVAVAAYIVDMGGYVALLQLGLPPIISNIIVKIFAAIFGFYAHRFFTYQIKNNDNILGHALRYFGMVALYTPVSSLLLLGAINVFKNVVVSKLICDVILFLLVYWITSKFTFLQSKELGQQ